MESNNRSLRIAGGLLGIIAVALTIPSYLVATPDTQSTPVDPSAFPGFLFANGTLVLVHVIALLLFIVVLAANVAETVARYAVLAGGIGFTVLTGVGVSVEVVPVAALLIDEGAAADGAAVRALALWIYGFALALGVVLMLGGAAASLGGRTFPAWFGWVSLVLAVVALLRPVLTFWAAYAVLVWIVIASLLLILQRAPQPAQTAAAK